MIRTFASGCNLYAVVARVRIEIRIGFDFIDMKMSKKQTVFVHWDGIERIVVWAKVRL